MRFLIIVLCLLSEKYITHDYQHLRKTWLNVYTHLVQSFLPKKFYRQNIYTPFFSCIISLLVIVIFFKTLRFWKLGLFINVVFEFFVFYICLGGDNLFYSETNDKDYLKINEYILAIHEEVFAIIILFFIFGPIGALLYRVTTFFIALQPKAALIRKIHGIIDWVPVRITALLLLMVGHFQPGFSYFLQHLTRRPDFNQTLLLHTAKNALAVKDKESVDSVLLENMYTHASLLFVFILAIFVIGQVI
jgi:AmpE protein